METLKEFELCHPCVDLHKIPHLYRFKNIRGAEDSHLEDFFVHGKLYHPLPSQLNDPFECKPHFVWPSSPAEAKELRQYLAKQLRSNQGMSWKKAHEKATLMMTDRNRTSKILSRAAAKTYGRVRLCSFTTSKDNLLFWSHYGDSHQGMGLEFDSAGGPMRNARQVKYDNHYPNVDVPPPPDERAAKPALVKSRNWEYESEYRSFIIPDITEEESKWIRFIELAPSSLTGIYFGACAQDKDKDRILDLVERGIFNPRIYDAELCESTFFLKFKERPCA